MKRTDYEDVVNRYDDNQVRLNIPPDETLAAILDGAAGERVRVLDIGCGTGNYLAAQAAAFPRNQVDWFGLEPSPGMLKRAATKLTKVDLYGGRAEELPFGDSSFDYVTCSFMFHHIEGKEQALDEIARVLKPNGLFRMTNVAPMLMPGWWPRVLFPETAIEDERRFWSPELICYELETRAFDVTLRVHYDRSLLPFQDILAEAERRDMSQLANLDDATYTRGLSRIRAILDHDPDSRYPNEFAILTCVARAGAGNPVHIWRG